MSKGLINLTTEVIDSAGDKYISTASREIKEQLSYMIINICYNNI